MLHHLRYHNYFFFFIPICEYFLIFTFVLGLDIINGSVKKNIIEMVGLLMFVKIEQPFFWSEIYYVETNMFANKYKSQ